MKHIVLLLSFIAISGALAACSMDSTGGMERGNTTMSGDKVFEPNLGL